jgi:hypothetical protein
MINSPPKSSDLKIASAAIANRFKQVLGGIISDTQKGFMKDRFMGENTRLLYDLMHYLEENDMDGLFSIIHQCSFYFGI